MKQAYRIKLTIFLTSNVRFAAGFLENQIYNLLDNPNGPFRADYSSITVTEFSQECLLKNNGAKIK